MDKNNLFVLFFILSFVSFSIAANAFTIQDFANSLSQLFSTNTQTNATTAGFNFVQWFQNLLSPQPLAVDCGECTTAPECSPGYSCNKNHCCVASGGTTGSCQPGQCDTYPNCITPSCSGKACGQDNGCGYPCSGYCSNGGQCINGHCQTQSQDCANFGGICKSSCSSNEQDIRNTYQCGVGGHCCVASSPTCNSECSAGQKLCTSSLSYEFCRLGSNGCYQWVPTTCPSSTPYCSNGACISSTSTSTSSCIQSGSPTTQSYCKDSYGGTQPSQCYGSSQLIYYRCNSAGTACISDSIYCSSQCGNSGAICYNNACLCNTGACTTANQATNCASYTSSDKCKVGTCVNDQCQSQSVADGTACTTSSGSGTCQNGQCIISSSSQCCCSADSSCSSGSGTKVNQPSGISCQNVCPGYSGYYCPNACGPAGTVCAQGQVKPGTQCLVCNSQGTGYSADNSKCKSDEYCDSNGNCQKIPQGSGNYCSSQGGHCEYTITSLCNTLTEDTITPNDCPTLQSCCKAKTSTSPTNTTTSNPECIEGFTTCLASGNAPEQVVWSVEKCVNGKFVISVCPNGCYESLIGAKCYSCKAGDRRCSANSIGVEECEYNILADDNIWQTLIPNCGPNGCANGACKATIGNPYVLKINPQIAPANTQNSLTLFVGKPVANGIAVDDSNTPTVTPYSTGTITTITFLFGDTIKVVVGKVLVTS